MATVKVIFPKTEKSTANFMFVKFFRNSEIAIEWAKRMDKEVDEMRGNLWPRWYSVNGRKVARIDDIEF